jgi:hypothetical protein
MLLHHSLLGCARRLIPAGVSIFADQRGIVRGRVSRPGF